MLSDHSIRSFDDLQRLLHRDSVGKLDPPLEPQPLPIRRQTGWYLECGVVRRVGFLEQIGPGQSTQGTH